METLIVHPETQEKADALKAILKVLNVAYEEDIDTTDYLMSTKANKESLKKSINKVRREKQPI